VSGDAVSDAQAMERPAARASRNLRAGPAEETSRIAWLDALRGFALLGILWANVRQMFLPFEAGGFAVALGGSERLAWLDWQVFHALIDLKFLTLFSLLFGVSFALQNQRLDARGHGFTAIYLRRVLILALLGVAHGLLLYSAEVLLCYAIAGLLLLTMRRWSSERLLHGGLILLGVTLVWGYQIGSLGRVSLVITLVSAVMLAAVILLLWRRSRPLALAAWTAVLIAAAIALTLQFAGGSPEDALAHEYRAAQAQLAAIADDAAATAPEEWRVRQGADFGALLRLHAAQYAQLLLYLAIFLLWRTLALFMIGAGIFRSGFVTKGSAIEWSGVARIGLGVGLPLSLAATWLTQRELVGVVDWRWPDFLHTLSTLPLAAGLAGLVFLWRARPGQRWLWSRVEAAGRTALTNYIGQSFAIALLAEAWGFGLYGELNGVAMTVTAIVVYALLAEGSYLWLRYFRLGPLEWLWRCGTYWQWLPNRRTAA
jgi:uncharacterized protein